MRKVVYCSFALALVALAFSVHALEPAGEAGDAALTTALFAAPAPGDCQGPKLQESEVSQRGEDAHTLLPPGCSGHCYAEITCPDGRYVGCYGGNSNACRVEGDYVVCDATYYSCEQCQQEQPFALGCEYCDT